MPLTSSSIPSHLDSAKQMHKYRLSDELQIQSFLLSAKHGEIIMRSLVLAQPVSTNNCKDHSSDVVIKCADLRVTGELTGHLARLGCKAVSRLERQAGIQYNKGAIKLSHILRSGEVDDTAFLPKLTMLGNLDTLTPLILMKAGGSQKLPS